MFQIIQQLDDTILLFLSTHLHTLFMDKFMVFMTALGNSSCLWSAMTVFLLLSRKERKWGILLAIGLLLELLLCDGILKPLIARERPFTRLDGYPDLIRAPLSYSFPSGHTMSSFTAAVILFLRQKSSGIFFLVLASLIGFSRLYLFVHYPSDVLAGALLGTVLALFLTKQYGNFELLSQQKRRC